MLSLSFDKITLYLISFLVIQSVISYIFYLSYFITANIVSIFFSKLYIVHCNYYSLDFWKKKAPEKRSIHKCKLNFSRLIFHHVSVRKYSTLACSSFFPRFSPSNWIPHAVHISRVSGLIVLIRAALEFSRYYIEPRN